MPTTAHYFSSEKHEEMLRANLYSTIKVKEKRNKEDTNEQWMMTSMVTIVCGDGGIVEVDRLLLVLMSPFYRNILTQEDVSTVIIPDVSLLQLSADFFNLLHQLSESNVNREEGEYRECGLKEEIKLNSHFWVENSNYNNISGDYVDDDKKSFPELTECETILYDEDEVGVTAPEDTDKDTNYSPSLKQLKTSESSKIKRRIFGKKKGMTTCAKCDKQYSNRTVPPRCECGYDLGGKSVKTSKFDMKTHEGIVKKKNSRGGELDVKVLCNQCGKIFRNRKQLRSHMPTCSIDKFPCDCELSKSINSRDRARHVRAVHLGWVTCPHSGCNKQLENDVAVAAHIEIQHNNGEGFECESCGETHISKVSLQYHIDAYHKEKKFQTRMSKRNILYIPCTCYFLPSYIVSRYCTYILLHVYP